MVCLTENPSFCDASCCKVEVINGALGERLEGFFSMEETLKSADKSLVANANASSFDSKSLLSLTSTNSPLSLTSSALTL